MRKYLWPAVIIVAVIGVGLGAYTMRQPDQSPQAHVDRRVVTEDSADDQPVAQSHRGYELEIVSGTTNVQPGQETRIVYRVRNDRGEVLKSFETVHEKIMHFIAVRKDLQGFQHLHPDFNQATGEFTIAVTFPTDGPYRIFPDFTPGKDAENPMLLPVTLSQDINVGNLANYSPQPVRPDTVAEKTVGMYQVSFAQPNPLLAQSEVTYTLTVKKNGQPVNNLEKYLGAMGHSVILKEATLDFIHTHAETATGRPSDISFTTTFPEAGVYKTFTQFQHEGKVLTSDFFLEVKENTEVPVDAPSHGGQVQH